VPSSSSRPGESITLDYAREPGGGGRTPLSLHVIGDRLSAIHPLPSEGEVTIGRSDAADVRIKDPSISRTHAILRIGPPLCVEDAGSANGVRVGGRRLARGETAEIGLGEAVDLGSVTIVVKKRPLAEALLASAGALLQSAGASASATPMQRLHELVDKVAEGTISVLILGETGVGKEVMAEAIHRKSPRARRPFLRINCGGLSEALLESELFGHEKGAFTGAVATKPGLFETAHGGTVFLDEVGEMPLPLQVKLLRVLEDRQVTRVGALAPRLVDVRFVAATNRDLEAEVQRGRFRQDLYFRLSGVTLHIPPLRERRDEIEGLARAFLGAQPGARTIAPAAMELLLQYAWPGNIRELRNVIERAALLCTGDVIGLEHLPVDKMRAAMAAKAAEQAPAPSSEAPSRPAPSGGLKDEIDAVERRRILDALERCAGNQSEAARLLGISRGTLLARIQKYGLPRPRKRR
jgi:transcriptional regulator with PAS, ATPase and Fis domain